jgi:hypothetical protein
MLVPRAKETSKPSSGASLYSVPRTSKNNVVSGDNSNSVPKRVSVVVLSRPNLEFRSVLQPSAFVKQPDERRFPRRHYCR